MTPRALETTATRRLRVLLVEDNRYDVELCLRELKKAGFDTSHSVVQTSHELCARLADETFDIVLADYTLPTWTGIEAVELLQQMEREIPVILITGTLTDEAASDCLAKGAADYVHKDRMGRLAVAVERALELAHLRQARQDSERRLATSERSYRRLTELSPDPLFIASADQLVYLNAAGVKLFGADSARELMGQSLSALVDAARQNEWRDLCERVNSEQEPSVFETRFVRLDGKTVDVKIGAAAISYQTRPALQFVARDVSERKRVEEAIKSLAAFAQYNPNPVLEFSLDGQLTYHNGAAMEMARLLGREDPTMVLPPDTPVFVRRCLLVGTKISLETSVGGRTFFWSFFPITPNQVVHCYVTDVTDRLNLEGQLRHSQKLESVGRLAAGVAHDFNNILTVIQGHTGLLRANPSLGPEMGESVQEVSRAAERAGKLTSQLLAFSRRSVLQPRCLDLNETLTQVSSLLCRTLGEDITYQFCYQPDLQSIYADPGMIEQVVMTLAVNARDAMPQGGQLVITTSSVEVDTSWTQRNPEARPGHFVCLTMTDTGCGMDQVTMSRLFEPFFTTKEFGKGTGLGLATVYGIVKQHQGWIDVQSQPGQGSSFKIYLPPSTEDMMLAETVDREDAPAQGNETILVVEDEAPVRQTARNILERYGYQVLEAANGVEALAIWHRRHEDIALLLTDMVMPVGLSGQELAEKFTNQKPGLRVIYTSGYSVEAAGKGSALLEGLHFLQKPFDAQRLAQSVRDCLDSY